MVCVTPSIMGIIQADTARRRAAKNAAHDRVVVPRADCEGPARRISNSIAYRRNEKVEQLLRTARTKRVAQNKWLPRWFKFSLENAVIMDSLLHEVMSAYLLDSNLMGACMRIQRICEQDRASEVSVTRRDWTLLQQALSAP